MLQLKLTDPQSLGTIDDLFNEFIMLANGKNSKITEPIYDIIENDNEFIIDFNLAGIKKEDVSVNVEKDTLTIKAERKEEKDLTYNHKESYFGIYEKSFTLSDAIDKEKIDASFVNGILKLKIPKIKEAKTNKISIKIN